MPHKLIALFMQLMLERQLILITTCT